MQTYPRDLLSQALPAPERKKRSVVVLIVAAMAAFTLVCFCAAAWLTYVHFLAPPSGPTIDLVGRWKQEQPLGDAAGSAGWNRWTYTFTTDGRFKVHAERKVTGKPWQEAQVDSSGRWTFSRRGNLVMTFDSDGKSESVMVSRFNSTTLAVDKGSTRTFLERIE